MCLLRWCSLSPVPSTRPKEGTELHLTGSRAADTRGGKAELHVWDHLLATPRCFQVLQGWLSLQKLPELRVVLRMVWSLNIGSFVLEASSHPSPSCQAAKIVRPSSSVWATVETWGVAVPPQREVIADTPGRRVNAPWAARCSRSPLLWGESEPFGALTWVAGSLLSAWDVRASSSYSICIKTISSTSFFFLVHLLKYTFLFFFLSLHHSQEQNFNRWQKYKALR